MICDNSRSFRYDLGDSAVGDGRRSDWRCPCGLVLLVVLITISKERELRCLRQ